MWRKKKARESWQCASLSYKRKGGTVLREFILLTLGPHLIKDDKCINALAQSVKCRTTACLENLHSECRLYLNARGNLWGRRKMKIHLNAHPISKRICVYLHLIFLMCNVNVVETYTKTSLYLIPKIVYSTLSISSVLYPQVRMRLFYFYFFFLERDVRN